MPRKLFFLSLIAFFQFDNIIAQNFSVNRTPGIVFYQLGLGAGTFFTAPRPTLNFENIVNQKMPMLTLSLGRRYSDHLSVKSNLSFQPFSAKEFIGEQDGQPILDPIFDGNNFAIDITPFFNAMPSYNLKKRFPIDLNLGIGIGYLITNRTEKFYFNNKYYEINLTEPSLYIPIRAAISLKLGHMSDITLEGAFFNTWLDNQRPITKFKRDSDHFAHLNIMFKRYIF